MTINLAALELQLVDQVANTTDTEELLIYSKILSKLKNQWVVPVSTLADLPAAADSEGEIYFVEEYNRLYFSNSSAWRHLDNTAIGCNYEIYGWGSNTQGQIGNNTYDNSGYSFCLVPAKPCGGFTDWVYADSGPDFTVALRSNGTLWSMGNGYGGLLGNNDTVDISSPVSVVGGFTDWCQVSVGYRHAAAVRSNGTLWTWGSGSGGRLGDNSTYYRSSPVSVVGGFTDWCQVSAENTITIALRTNGTLWAWGCGCYGQAGTGYANVLTGGNSSSSPVSVVGGFTDWCQVSAGEVHTAAIRTNGTLWTWGRGNTGRLGDNSTYYRSSPVSVVGGFTDWCQVSAGEAHTAAVRTNGTLWTWGDGVCGKLGNTSITNRSSPVSVVGGFTDWTCVSAGSMNTHAVRGNGSLWAWGFYEMLGTPSDNSRSSPICVVGPSDWISVNGGAYSPNIWATRAEITG